jgi:hypothetical protein
MCLECATERGYQQLCLVPADDAPVTGWDMERDEDGSYTIFVTGARSTRSSSDVPRSVFTSPHAVAARMVDSDEDN